MNQLLNSISIICIGLGLIFHLITGAHLNEYIAATTGDSGCTTSQQEAAPGKTRADVYNYAMLRGE